jgi:hypothetical protein
MGDSSEAVMYRHASFLTTAALAALAAAAGCGDSQHNTPLPDAPAPPDAPPDMSPPPDMPPDETPPPSCDIAWTDQQLGTELDDQVWGMATDDRHNVYVVGYEHGVTGVTNIEPDGDAHGVIMQLAPTGEVRWKTVVDTSASDTVEGVAIDAASHRIYVVGRTAGSFPGFTNQGQFDTFLVGLDPAGHMTTLLQSGDDRPAHPTRLSLGLDHDLAVAGFDDTWIPTNNVAAEEDGFIAKFDRGTTPDAAFAQTMLQKVPVTSPNRITDVVVDRDGSGAMYVTSVVTGRRNDPGIFVKKLNRDGTVAWSNKISPITADAANAVGLSPQNELFVAGATFQTLPGQVSAGQQDAYVLKLDKATGAIIWAAQGGSDQSDYPTAMAFDAAGNVFVAGYTLGAVTKDANHGGIDAFAMKFDATGTRVSSWQAGTAADDFVTSMTVDACGKAFIGGNSKGAVVAGHDATAGGYDMFIMRATL